MDEYLMVGFLMPVVILAAVIVHNNSRYVADTAVCSRLQFYSVRRVHPHDYLVRDALVDVAESPWRKLLESRHDKSLRLLISLDFASFDRLYHDIFTAEELADEWAVKVGRPPLLTLKDQVR
jgi:hypothetical protein